MKTISMCSLAMLSFAGSYVSSSAATLSSFATKDGKIVAVLKGEIATGDADALTIIIKQANAQSKFVSGVRLYSPGGDLTEGVRLADVVRTAKMASIVPAGAICASACFVVFAAGGEKYVSNSAMVGVHGASENGSETPSSSAATIEMARIVKDLGVPSAVLGKMVVTPPSEVVWLTGNDLRAMGTIMTGKPSQTAGLPATATPMQIPPTTNGSSVQANVAPTWKSFTDEVIKTSASQNGGKAAFYRNCQPEMKICNNGVFFRGKNGISMMVRTADDLDGKQITREVCSFNSFGDVRKCINWDSGAVHTDMKDSSGNWSAVANN